MRTGSFLTLQFISMSDPASEAIKLFERGWCSHVDIVMPDKTLLGARSDSVGGKPPGVQVRPPNYEAWDRAEQLSVSIDSDGEANFYSFLSSQIGKPYDRMAIAALAFERQARQNPDAWFCSELACSALEAAGFWSRPLPIQTTTITPRDLYLFLYPWAQ